MAKPAVLTVDDLRTLELFTGLTDRQLGELLEAGLEVQVEPGVELFREGEHADFWWVLVDGAIQLLRHVGREETVVGRMEVPGRWAGGFRAWDEQGVYLATGRGAAPGRVLRVPADALHELFTAWFPFGVHLVAGLYGTARSIESTVRQRESLVTLGTLAAGLAHEINNPAAAATRAVAGLEETTDVLLSRLGRLAEHGISAEQFQALDALRRGLGPPPVPEDVLVVSDREEELTEWLEDHDVERAWDLAAELAAAGADRRGAPRSSGPPRSVAAAGTGVGRQHPRALGPPRRGQGVDAAGLGAGRRRPVVLPDGPGLAPAGRRDRGPREHAGDARSQAARRHRGRPRLRQPTSRSSTAIPAS